MIRCEDKIKSGICIYDYVIASSSVIFDWNKKTLRIF